MGRFRELSAQADREHRAFIADRQRVEPNWYMVSVNCAGSVYVKELVFFHEQGGFKQAWGKHWDAVVANNIEHAREVACKRLADARPYEQQAKP